MGGLEILTVAEAMKLSTDFLTRKGSSSPRLDAQILTAHSLGIRKLDLYLSPDRPLSEPERDLLRELMVRRGRGEPVAYIVGHREFFGLTFSVTPDVLIPRPETESIVDRALQILEAAEAGGKKPEVADIGTGSGAIACTIAHRNPTITVLATDISADALQVARTNASRLEVDDRIDFIVSDVYDNWPQGRSFDMIISNPPYIATDEAGLVDPGAMRFEPQNALFSGPDGTDVSFRIIDGLTERLSAGGTFLIETGTPSQTARVRTRLKEIFESVTDVTDPGGNVRGLAGTTPRHPA